MPNWRSSAAPSGASSVRSAGYRIDRRRRAGEFQREAAGARLALRLHEVEGEGGVERGAFAARLQNRLGRRELIRARGQHAAVAPGRDARDQLREIGEMRGVELQLAPPAGRRRLRPRPRSLAPPRSAMASLSSDSLSPVLPAFSESEPPSTAACPTRAIRSFAASSASETSKSPSQFAAAGEVRRRVDVERVGLEIQEHAPARAVQRLREGQRAGEIRAVQPELQVAQRKADRRGFEIARSPTPPNRAARAMNAFRRSAKTGAPSESQSASAAGSPTCASTAPRNSGAAPSSMRPREFDMAAARQRRFQLAPDRLAGIGDGLEIDILDRLRAQERRRRLKRHSDLPGRAARRARSRRRRRAARRRARPGGAETSPSRRSSASTLSCLDLRSTRQRRLVAEFRLGSASRLQRALVGAEARHEIGEFRADGCPN